MKRIFHWSLALVGSASALWAACYVNGPSRECPPTVPHNGMTCTFVSGQIPWVSPAPPNVSGWTQACATGPHCQYVCPNGDMPTYYTGAVAGGCGVRCIGNGTP